MNNMLAGITGNLFIAKKKLKDHPDVMVKLDMIETISFRAADMIQQLLTFARQGTVNMKDVAFVPFMQETLNFLRSSVPENIMMYQDICNDTLIINADSTQLHQILMNLLSNAIDAVQGVDKPSISIRIEAFFPDETFLREHKKFIAGVGYAYLSVIDNGCGIPKEKFEHLFEPFFTTKEQGKGTGLGLAMVFGALEMHHGHIEVESIEGEGTTFHIYIPLQESKGVAYAERLDDQPVEGHGKLILLVDDDQNVRETTAEVLESMGYRVLKAEDGLQAIEVFEAKMNEIDLALLDIVMPNMGGKQLAERIRALESSFPIIFMTGYDKEHVFDHDEQPANTEMITKPVQFSHLSSRIRQLLG